MATLFPAGSDTFTGAHADGINEHLHAADINTLQDGLLAVQAMLAGRPTFNVKAFGAKVDGSTDDTAAVAAAIAAAAAYGGGDVFFPYGTCLCTTTTTAGGLTWILGIAADNIRLRGVGPGSILKTTQAAELIYVTGAGKPAGILNWPTYLWQYTPFTQSGGVYPTATQAHSNLLPMSGVQAQGSYTITLTSSLNAATFAAGDWIDIRSGEILPSTTANADRELNQVISVSGAVITLRWPLAKAYAQEFWPATAPVFLGAYAGSFTSTSNTGDPAPFGVQKVTSSVLKSFAVTDMQLQALSPSSPNGNAISGNCCYGMHIERVTIAGTNSGVSFGADRATRYLNNNVYIQNSYLTNGCYFFSTSDGSVDVLVSGNSCDAPSSQGYMHVHEGSSNVRVLHNRFSAGNVAATGNICSVRGRANSISIVNNQFSGSGTQAALYVDPQCSGGGVIAHNDVIAPNASAAIEVDAAGWIVGPNTTHGGVINLVAADGSLAYYAGSFKAANFVGTRDGTVHTVTTGSTLTLPLPLPSQVSLTCAGAVTGFHLAVSGGSPQVGQRLTLINEGAGSITFASGGGTAGNTADSIAANRGITLEWNEQSVWYLV